MTSEVEERPRLVTGGYGQHRRQWVNNYSPKWRWLVMNIPTYWPEYNSNFVCNIWNRGLLHDPIHGFLGWHDRYMIMWRHATGKQRGHEGSYTRYTIDDSARYTIDDSARYTICLQNSMMRGVQKKLVYFGGNYWTMLFSSQKKRHTARKIYELIKTTVLIACLFYEPPKRDFVWR